MDHKIKPSLELTERKQLVVLLCVSLKIFSILTNSSRPVNQAGIFHTCKQVKPVYQASSDPYIKYKQTIFQIP